MSRILLSAQNTELIGSLPPDLTDTPEFLDSWHHLAVIFKNKQVKIYIDQFRILVVPEVVYVPKLVSVAASANPQETAVFKNFKLAKGGEMNDILHLMTEGKYISYGIRFDINKSTIKPESMGAINEIIQVLKSNPGLKFEVGGHTDADGDESANLILSQKRAESVVTLIISKGIESSRLTAMGYGERKPIADNNTFDGRAKNRRVEFLKK
ncbi:MAG: OmpA family protein [Ignavibacteriales bacterium]|nr:OmpA family protein [Ignavibacteriales bacterium]